MRKLFRRNERILGKYAGKVKLTSPQGTPQDTLCLQRDGITGILMKLDFSRIKDKARQEKVIQFQAWAIEALNKEMQIQSQLIKPQAHEAWSDTASNHIRFAKAYAEASGIDPGLAIAKALTIASRETGIDLTGYSRLLPAVQPEEQFLSATEIGIIIGRSGKEINKYLYNKGYLYRESGEYYMTEKARPYGRLYPYGARSGHAGYYIRWSREILRDSGLIH